MLQGLWKCHCVSLLFVSPKGGPSLPGTAVDTRVLWLAEGSSWCRSESSPGDAPRSLRGSVCVGGSFDLFALVCASAVGASSSLVRVTALSGPSRGSAVRDLAPSAGSGGLGRKSFPLAEGEKAWYLICHTLLFSRVAEAACAKIFTFCCDSSAAVLAAQTLKINLHI